MKIHTKARRSDAVSQREKDNLAVAYKAACEGIVLLKNDGALPFKTKKVALYGSGASMTIKGGTGSGEVNERHSVTILEGMRDRGFQIATEKWLDDFAVGYEEAKKVYHAEKQKRVNILKVSSIMDMLMENFKTPAGRPITMEDVTSGDTDSCIYVVSRQAGEGGDRRAEKGDMFLTDDELAHIRFCAEHYEKFVLVINGGSAIDMAFAEQIGGINAILFICQLGTEGGHAFADVISGDVTPSGKLTDTWAKQYSDIPFANEFSYLNGNLKEEFYREGIYVGYRYFDSFGVAPAYPFGFGLSYTDFDLKCEKITLVGSQVTVSAKVTNVGSEYSGKEVAQLYVSAPEGAMDKEYQSLAAFGKTRLLAPGETQIMDLRFDLTRMASYREQDTSYVLEAGEYILRLGNSSRCTRPVGLIAVEKEIVVSTHTHICPVREPIEELTAPARSPEEVPAQLPRLTLAPEAVKPVVHTYEEPEECMDKRIQKFLNNLSLNEMVEIVVGIGMFGGLKRFHLPGSVGNTTSKLWDKGLANVALCDGPAGLRVQQKSTMDKQGNIKAVSLAMSTFNYLPEFVKKFMVGDPKKDPVLYQYTTAFPVANALAQSWNTELMEEVGKAVYREMQEYGCTYWLAPAVNIHRNPLCGRNFEYYSEDPLLTGVMAAAITKGVQQEDGFYVTVKHFACNNQEDNRTHVSSNVSERALREIYLRGFEETVRNGHAKSIMTSYNRLNGIYTPNSHDLCTKVLRNEWGFDGVVMTDWFSTNPGQGSNALCMMAGNDLIMPGGAIYKAEILMGVKTGKITRAQVRRCCSHVVKSIFDSAIQKEYIG